MTKNEAGSSSSFRYANFFFWHLDMQIENSNGAADKNNLMVQLQEMTPHFRGLRKMTLLSAAKSRLD